MLRRETISNKHGVPRRRLRVKVMTDHGELVIPSGLRGDELYAWMADHVEPSLRNSATAEAYLRADGEDDEL